MNIIFGKHHADQFAEKYTVLELDTIRFANNDTTVTAYCVVEGITLDKLPMIESMQNLHKDLIAKYQSKNWTTCLQIIKLLRGFWNDELDSFYDNLQKRIEKLLEQPLDTDWSPVIQK